MIKKHDSIGMVALFGVDGSGKSTVADLVQSRLIAQNHDVKRFHWRPRIIYRNKKVFNDPAVTDPDGLQTRNKSLSFALYFFFFLDFWLAYVVNISPFTNKGGIVIYERYFFDLLFHPRRYKLTEFSKLGLTLSKMSFNPDRIYVLEGDPAIIHSRKPELTIEEIKRQSAHMRQFFKHFGNVQYIDVGKISASEISNILFNDISTSQKN